MNPTRSSWIALVLAAIAPEIGAQVCPNDDAFEPNDTCSTAWSLEAVFHPNFYLIGDNADVWRFAVPAGEGIDIQVLFSQSLGNIDGKLVTGDCNSPIAYLTSDTDNESASWTNTGVVAQEVVLHLEGVDGFLCNSYALDVQVGNPGDFTPYCFGDGSAAPCPCGNTSGPGTGCAHSGGHGARLAAMGSSGVSSDDMQLRATALLPGKAALLFAGTESLHSGAGEPFGDGLRCAGASVVRLDVRIPDAIGLATWGPGLIASAGWSAGETRYLQVWYRDVANSPCNSAFNLTNGLAVVFER